MATGHFSLPAVRGGSLALLAAVLFGVSTPLVQHFGKGLGAFSTAALLYAGAALVGLLSRQRVEREARLVRPHNLAIFPRRVSKQRIKHIYCNDMVVNVTMKLNVRESSHAVHTRTHTVSSAKLVCSGLADRSAADGAQDG